ncbi:AAA family ATPase, partial [Mesomycoplasma ovipneumoniae]
MARKIVKQKKENIAEKLTEEQQNVINLALKGENILVDACIGSGKTSVIQVLCDKFPIDKKILYLTYNKLLKVEAK